MSGLLDRLHRAPTPGADVPADQTVVTTPRQRPVPLLVPEWIRRMNERGLPAKEMTTRVLEP